MTSHSGFLLDTNVLSETRKKQPDSGVISFLESADPSALYLSVLTLGELRKGAMLKRQEDEEAGEKLSVWIDGLESSFSDRIFPIDAAIARLWGEWSSDRPRAVVDTLLAATAKQKDLTLVTRNVRHIEGLPLRVVNPWIQ